MLKALFGTPHALVQASSMSPKQFGCLRMASSLQAHLVIQAQHDSVEKIVKRIALAKNYGALARDRRDRLLSKRGSLAVIALPSCEVAARPRMRRIRRAVLASRSVPLVEYCFAHSGFSERLALQVVYQKTGE
jgi:hypothetical protein